MREEGGREGGGAELAGSLLFAFNENPAEKRPVENNAQTIQFPPPVASRVSRPRGHSHAGERISRSIVRKKRRKRADRVVKRRIRT